MIQLARVGMEAPHLLKRNLSRLCCCCFTRRLTSTQRVCPHHATMQRQSLRLIQMGQCLCTDPNLLPFIMHPASHVLLVHRIPDFKAPEASTGHTSPFRVRTKKKHLSMRVHVDAEIACNSSKSATYCFRTCIHCRAKRCARITAESPEEFIFPCSTGNTQTQDV